MGDGTFWAGLEHAVDASHNVEIHTEIRWGTQARMPIMSVQGISGRTWRKSANVARRLPENLDLV